MRCEHHNGWYPLAVQTGRLMLVAAVAVFGGAGGAGCSDDAAAGASTVVSAASQASSTQTPKSRIIMIAIDSLNPDYIKMNADASGPGGPGDWLMPRVRQFVKGAAHWPGAKAAFPQATDSNHLNILAATDTGLTGVIGVYKQPYRWKPAEIHVGRIHLAKARYPDGSQVKTLFDLAEQATGGQARTAFLGNKNWVPEEYGPASHTPSTVDIFVNGVHHPSYVPAPVHVSYHDDPATDPDAACDPESIFQTLVLNYKAKKKPADHPRDTWITEATIKVMEQENPDMTYVLLGDLDHAQHSLGALNNPAEWIQGPLPQLPLGCAQKPRYRLVSKRNPRLYKEPILDLVRAVDHNFGRLMDRLAAGGFLTNARVILVSDHNMINYLYRKDIEALTDVTKKLQDAGLAPKKSFYNYGAGSMGLLYWRPEYQQQHPSVVLDAKNELLDPKHLAYNHELGRWELPWAIMDRYDMEHGRADLGIGPKELYNPHFVKNGVWPDLAVVMLNGWQVPSGSFNLGEDTEFTLFNAGHGGPDTAAVMVAIKGFGFPAGATCSGPVRLADVGMTVAKSLGWAFPYSVGSSLGCVSK